MLFLHQSYGKVYVFDERADESDIPVSPALESLIDAGIVDTDHGVDFGWNNNEPGYYTFELMGPWQGSDYSGDDITESNQRSLVRDFKDLLIDSTRYSGWSSYGLQIEPTFGLDEETSEEAESLADTLIGLVVDYPLYDESDNSELVHERATESWDQYLRSDLEGEISDLTGLSLDLENARDAFWELCSDNYIYPEAEGHRDVILPGVKDRDFLLDLARAAIANGCLDWEDVQELEPAGYEVVGDILCEDYAPIPGQMLIAV